jgi:hypothetical protein
LIPNQCQRLFVMLGNIDPFEQILSRAGAIQAPEYIHERGFAAPARTHDGQELPALNLHTHSAQCVHACFAQFVVLVHVFDLDDRTRRLCGYPSFDLVGRWQLLLDAGLARLADSDDTNDRRDSDSYSQSRQDASHLVPKECHQRGLQQSCIVHQSSG